MLGSLTSQDYFPRLLLPAVAPTANLIGYVIGSGVILILMAATGVSEYNVLENNGAGAHQEIKHVHFHIIPKPNASAGLGVGWPARAIDHGEGAKLAEKIRALT